MKRAVQHDAVQDGAGLTRAPRNRATLARRSRMRAFTLVELMVVVLIIGILVEVSTLWIPSDIKYVGALGVLVLILLVRPQGLLGRRARIG